MDIRARASDPLTSHMAADQSVRFADSHKARIMHVLRTSGSDGMTPAQIAEASGLSLVQVDRRLTELGRSGQARVVQDNGEDLIIQRMRVWVAA